MTTQQRLSRKESQQQTRTRLLNAAAHVFSRRGFYAASIDEVAAEAGFSKGAVYSNFASKEDLLLALMEQHFDNEMREFAKLGRVPEAKQAPGETRGFTQAIDSERTWNLLLLEFFLYAMREDSVREKVASRLRTLHERMAASLEEMYAARGEKPALPIEQIPLAISALGIGLTIQYYLSQETFPDSLYERALEQVLR